MNKIGSTFILTLGSMYVFAQSPVQVTGSMNREKPGHVKLFKVSDGKPEEIADTTPNSAGKFGFVFYPEYEGLYLIGTGGQNNPSDNYTFYFKQGDKLSLTLKENNYELTGSSNSKENVVLRDWFKLSEPIYQKSINFMKGGASSTYVDFFPDLENVVAKSSNFLKGRTTGNSKFDHQIKEIIELDLANYASNFINTPRTAHPSSEEFSNYYKGLSIVKLSKTAAKIYGYPWGKRLLNSMLMISISQKKVAYKDGVEGLGALLPLISNDTLKGDFVLERMSRLKNYSEYMAYTNSFGKYFLTEQLKKQQREILATLATLKPGEAAFNFSYPDKNGNMVSMADLKGKVVLVDVWATWCGPCKGEIPHLKKLEEELKGTDVQVVSISVDEAKDKEKWLKMVKDENLGGVQLFASGWGELAKYYKIDGIPRFMVFDKTGKIVTVDSPRPSTPELKVLLEKTLTN